MVAPFTVLQDKWTGGRYVGPPLPVSLIQIFSPTGGVGDTERVAAVEVDSLVLLKISQPEDTF